MTPSWGPYGPHVGATLLPNSGGMAISATFAEDGMEPETCHLCFTALPLKTCMCMCARELMRVCVCVRVCVHACVSACVKGGRIISRHLVRGRGWNCLTEARCVFVRVCERGGGGGCSDGILCVIRGRAASKCMRLLVINVSAVPFGHANIFRNANVFQCQTPKLYHMSE